MNGETCSEESSPVSAKNTALLLAVSFAIHSAKGILGSQNSISGEGDLRRAIYGFCSRSILLRDLAWERDRGKELR
jgi:hypothetical protein